MDMDDADTQLVAAARAILSQAYAPYSGYRVGAAVCGESGTIYAGCNVENASFSLTCCAERVAVFKAISAGERSLVSAAVVVEAGDLVAPCGPCRQVLNEFGEDMTVLLAGSSGTVQRIALSTLLPGSFGPRQVLKAMHNLHRSSDED